MTTILTVSDDTTDDDLAEAMANLKASAVKADTELMRMHDIGEDSAAETWRIRGDRLAEQIDGLCAEMAGRVKA